MTDLTLTNATYDTSAAKFGTGALSAGYGSVAQPLPTSGGFTLECWSRIATAPSAAQVCVGELNTAWLGIAASGGYARANYGSSTNEVSMISTVNIADGAWHHLALSVDDTGGALYVDGVQAATSATTLTTANPVRTAALGIRAFGSGASAFGGAVDEAALWTGRRYTAAFTPPTAAYTGSETNLRNLYHLDSAGTDSAGATVSPATAYTLSGPASGTVSTASSNFTVTAQGSLSAARVITPSDGGNGGTFTPATVTLAAGTNTSASFTYTPASTGAKTISTTNDGSLTNPAALTYTSNASGGATVAPNNAAFLYSDGNWDIQAAKAQTSNAGAEFAIMFTGASCTLNFDVSALAAAKAQIYYRIDGYSAQAPWTKATVAATIACAMPSDTSADPYHLLEVIVKSVPESSGVSRWTIGQVPFTGLTLASGAVVLAPAASAAPNLLVFGDSISEGCWNVNVTAAADVDRSDNMLTYIQRAGQLLGARIANCAWSGSGLTKAGTAGIPNCLATYGFVLSGIARSLKAPPAAILINHGTNDVGAADADVTTALTSLLNGLLSAYPAAPIMVLRPFNGSKASALQAGIAACSSPTQVSYVDTTGFYNTAYGQDTQYNTHPLGPNAIGQLAPKVANAIRAILYGPQNAALVTSVTDTDLVTLSKSGVAAQIKASDLKAYLKAS